MKRSACPFHDDLPALLREGYLFAGQRREEQGADDDRPVRLQLLGKPALLVRGVDAVRLFYDRSAVKRSAVSSLATTVAALCEPGVEIIREGLDVDWTQLPTRPEGGPRVTYSRPE